MLIISLQATNPEMKAAINPTINVTELTEELDSPVCLRMANRLAPIIGIKTIKNEKRVARSFLTPNINAVEMVAPDLEIPGITATACIIPIIKALR